VTETVQKLPAVSEAQLAEIRAADRTGAAHRNLLAAVPAMQMLQVGGAAAAQVLPAAFNIAAWNVERGLFPGKCAAALAPHAPQVVLLSEVDNGMARTGQANTTAEMAAAMGMHYAYGVEFLEMDLGGVVERQFCRDDFNALGFHGNAILSAAPFTRLALMRLDEEGHWFQIGPYSAGDPGQPRLGGRMAIAAELATEAGPICVVSVHLESNAKGDYRGRQFADLLERVQAFAGDLPVVIGGDLNTGCQNPPDYDWREEPLFALAQAQGYSWAATPEGPTIRASLISLQPTLGMKLDWFATRGLRAEPVAVLPALDPEGTPLSDHEAVICHVDLRSGA